ncbi:MAG: glycine cleavage system protein GcvH [Chitinophagales bacterium]|mgnify:CR=1 FL=1|jgi:glycine cleavage system H protein|nr:glycine cleavage system protein GcvH [Chitinophagales bacterium]
MSLIPANLRYTNDHEWTRVEADILYVGITDFAQSELGDIVYVDINAVGQTLQTGTSFGAVDAVKAASDLYMPLSGTIIAQNEALTNQPELVNSDPYGEGWMIQIKPDNLADLDALLSPEKYQELIGE